MNTNLVFASSKHMISEGVALRLSKEFNLKDECWVENESALISLCRQQPPDVILMCIAFCGQHTASFIRKLLSSVGPLNMIVVSGKSNRETILEVMESGAKGFLIPTHTTFEELVMSVRCLSDGRTYMCQKASEVLLGGLFAGNTPHYNEPLSEREKQIIRLVSDGNSSKEIARILGIAPSTVDAHRRKIMQKIGAHNTAGLTRYAISKQLVTS